MIFPLGQQNTNPSSVQLNGAFSSTAPPLSFQGASNLGMSQSGGTQMFFVYNGETIAIDFGSNQFRLSDIHQLAFSPADASVAAGDTGIGRAAPAVSKFTNGSSGGGTFAATADSPTALAANTNNYAPTGRSYFQRWSASTPVNITGLSISQVDGQTHLVVNTGANAITLVHQDAINSTAANRFLCSTGANIVLSQNQAADLVYDSAQSRWLVFKRA